MKAVKRRYTMTARAEKARETRARILAAAVDLYRDRPVEHFTLDDVAVRARTTVQTVLRVFGSKEDLVLAALTALTQAGMPTKPMTQTGDIAAAVREMFDLYETLGDLIIARLGDERRHPPLKAQLDEGRLGHRDWVAHAFAPFLGADTDRFEMLVVLTDVYVWKLLRRDRALDRDHAESLVVSMIDSIVKENSDGKTALA
jgi:AcrR family transcriptional regulator